MNKAEFIKGIDKTIEGLKMMREACASDEAATASTNAPTPAPSGKPTIGGKGKVTPPTAKTVGGKTAPAETAKSDVSYTVAELTAMKYNEFKKLAASLGVDCKGSRDDIMNRVIAKGVVSDAGEAPAKDSAKSPAPTAGGKSNKPASMGKGGVKKADAPAKDKFDEQAEAIIADTPAEDIIAALADVNVKATKLNYKTQLVKALREGLLTVDGDEETTDASSDETSGDEEMVAEDYYADYDLSEANDPENMSEARSAACINKQNDIIAAFADGSLTSDDIAEYLQTVCTQEEIDLLGDDYTAEDLLKLYIEVAKHLIDEDGEEHEPGEAYVIGETPFCCGQPLAYDEKTKKFLCATCAGEYEAE